MGKMIKNNSWILAIGALIVILSLIIGPPALRIEQAPFGNPKDGLPDSILPETKFLVAVKVCHDHWLSRITLICFGDKVEGVNLGIQSKAGLVGTVTNDEGRANLGQITINTPSLEFKIWDAELQTIPIVKTAYDEKTPHFSGDRVVWVWLFVK